MSSASPTARSRHLRECICGRGMPCTGVTQAFRMLGDPRCYYVELPRYRKDPPAYKYVFRNNLREAYLRHLRKQNPDLQIDETDKSKRLYVALHHFHPKVVRAFYENPLTSAQKHKVPISITEYEMKELGMEYSQEDRILSMSGRPTGGYYFVPSYSQEKAQDDLKDLIRIQRNTLQFGEVLATVKEKKRKKRSRRRKVPKDIQIEQPEPEIPEFANFDSVEAFPKQDEQLSFAPKKEVVKSPLPEPEDQSLMVFESGSQESSHEEESPPPPRRVAVPVTPDAESTTKDFSDPATGDAFAQMAAKAMAFGAVSSDRKGQRGSTPVNKASAVAASSRADEQASIPTSTTPELKNFKLAPPREYPTRSKQLSTASVPASSASTSRSSPRGAAVALAAGGLVAAAVTANQKDKQNDTIEAKPEKDESNKKVSLASTVETPLPGGSIHEIETKSKEPEAAPVDAAPKRGSVAAAIAAIQARQTDGGQTAPKAPASASNIMVEDGETDMSTTDIAETKSSMAPAAISTGPAELSDTAEPESLVPEETHDVNVVIETPVSTIGTADTPHEPVSKEEERHESPGGNRAEMAVGDSQRMSPVEPIAGSDNHIDDESSPLRSPDAVAEEPKLPESSDNDGQSQPEEMASIAVVHQASGDATGEREIQDNDTLASQGPAEAAVSPDEDLNEVASSSAASEKVEEEADVENAQTLEIDSDEAKPPPLSENVMEARQVQEHMDHGPKEASAAIAAIAAAAVVTTAVVADGHEDSSVEDADTDGQSDGMIETNDGTADSDHNFDQLWDNDEAPSQSEKSAQDNDEPVDSGEMPAGTTWMADDHAQDPSVEHFLDEAAKPEDTDARVATQLFADDVVDDTTEEPSMEESLDRPAETTQNQESPLPSPSKRRSRVSLVAEWEKRAKSEDIEEEVASDVVARGAPAAEQVPSIMGTIPASMDSIDEKKQSPDLATWFQQQQETKSPEPDEIPAWSSMLAKDAAIKIAHQLPGADPTFRIQVHNDLIAWESKRRSEIASQLQYSTCEWKGAREMLFDGLEEIKIAERLIYGSAQAGLIYAESMEKIYEDKFIDNHGNTVTNSFIQNRLMRSRNVQEYSIDASQTSTNSSESGQSALLQAIIDSQKMMTDQFRENSKHMEEEILPDVTELRAEIEQEVREILQTGDNIIAEMGRSESEVNKIWDVFDGMVTGDLMEYTVHGSLHGSTHGGSSHGGGSSLHGFGGSVQGFLTPRGENDAPIISSQSSPMTKSSIKQLGGVEDGWLVEMYYRIAISYQRHVFDVGQNEMRNIAKAIGDLQEKLQQRLQETMLAFVPRQRRLFLGLPERFKDVLEDLVGLRIDEDSLQAMLDGAIQERSRSLLRQSQMHRSSIMNRSKVSASMQDEVDAIEDLFGSPFVGSGVNSVRLLEIKPIGLGSLVNANTWKSALAIVTSHGMVHIMELPSSSITDDQEALRSLMPSLKFDSSQRWVRKTDLVKSLNPYVSLKLGHSSLSISNMRKRQIDVVEDAGAKRMTGPGHRLFNAANVQRQRKCTFRLSSPSEASEWVHQLEILKKQLVKRK